MRSYTVFSNEYRTLNTMVSSHSRSLALHVSETNEWTWTDHVWPNPPEMLWCDDCACLCKIALRQACLGRQASKLPCCCQ